MSRVAENEYKLKLTEEEIRHTIRAINELWASDECLVCKSAVAKLEGALQHG